MPTKQNSIAVVSTHQVAVDSTESAGIEICCSRSIVWVQAEIGQLNHTYNQNKEEERSRRQGREHGAVEASAYTDYEMLLLFQGGTWEVLRRRQRASIAAAKRGGGAQRQDAGRARQQGGASGAQAHRGKPLRRNVSTATCHFDSNRQPHRHTHWRSRSLSCALALIHAGLSFRREAIRL